MNVIPIHPVAGMARGGRQPHCLHCRAAPFCIAVRVRASAAHAQLQTRRIRLIRDEVLFRPGDAAGNRFYALHYGAIKHTLANAVGQDKIVGFLMSGELLGLEAIASNRHKGCATALEDSEVCEIHCGDLLSTPTLLHSVLSRQIAREQRAADILRNDTAGQRFAAFLMDYSRRYQKRGYSAHRFRLVMSRQDIANYLALTPESLSRVIAHLKQARLLDVQERDVTLLEPARLQRLASEGH